MAAPKRTPAKTVRGTATPQRKPAATRKKPVNKKQGLTPATILKYSVYMLLLTFIVTGGYRFRHGVLVYLGFNKINNKQITVLTKEKRKIGDLRIYEIVSRHKDRIFGFDVSHYQGKINWDSIQHTKGDFPLDFVFIRASAGKNRGDSEFARNWKHAKRTGFIRGAYHYYRPDENSRKQAENFIRRVTLHKGDLPPVLDIEKVPAGQSMDSLKSGLKRWLSLVEGHYGVKPILYSGESFHTDFLKNEFKGYTLWIANYSFFDDEIKKEWDFWQFTDRASILGIEGTVDANIFNGDLKALKKHCIK
jgi:lysozyme